MDGEPSSICLLYALCICLLINTGYLSAFLFKQDLSKSCTKPSLFIAMTAAKDDVTYQNGSPLGADAVRVKLRSGLMDYLHSFAPKNIQGYHRWTVPAAKNQAGAGVRLLVGDPIVLAVSPTPTLYLIRPLTPCTGKSQDPQAVQQAPLAGVRRRQPTL